MKGDECLVSGVTFLDLPEVFLSKNRKISENQGIKLAQPKNYSYLYT